MKKFKINLKDETLDLSDFKNSSLSPEIIVQIKGGFRDGTGWLRQVGFRNGTAWLRSIHDDAADN